MTDDATTPAQPRTAAGRSVLAYHRVHGHVDRTTLLKAILAIEAQASPAVASEGLPVDGIVAELMGVEAHLDEARERLIKANATLAALASDAGSVGALDSEGVNKIDPERLARALHLAKVQCEHVTDRASCADGGWHRGLAAAIVAAYDAERQGEP